ncbi:MAG: DUF547 domain-containing protein [Thermoplasmatota archaeon]
MATDPDELLGAVVDADGDVDYTRLRRAELQPSLDAIAQADLGTMKGPERYAFLLNAYNVTVLDAVLRRLWRGGRQVRSLRNPFWWLVFFLGTPVRVGGRRMSLYRLEFSLIKPHLRRDPRGHFALVCASTGCPPLRGGAYHGPELDAELDLAARAFLQPGGGYTLDRERGILRLNRILKWYAKDFGGRAGVLATFEQYAPANDAAWVAAHRDGLKLRYLRYDWDLNVAKAAESE